MDLDRLLPRLTGGILHSALAAVDPANAEVPVAGRLWGLDIIGRVDRLRDGWVEDYKSSNGKRAPDAAAWPDQVWQMEMYRELLRQMDVATVGWRLRPYWRGEWYLIEHAGPLWTEQQLGDFRPHGGAWTAAELAQLSQKVIDGLAVDAVPLVGVTQRMGSKWACDYCEAEEACKSSAPAF